MKPIERLHLIERIACELQDRMVTSDINAYLPHFGITYDWQGSCGSKRVYVKEILAPVDETTLLAVARDLELSVPPPVDHPARALADYLQASGSATCREDFARALDAISTDPGSAVGLACTTMESICKAILDGLGVPFPSDESLQSLMKEVAKKLNLSPDAHADEDIKRVLGGLANVAAGLAVLRTKYSTFHGKGQRQYRLGTRHARLAINSLAAAGQFLLETYVEQRKDHEAAI
jgi:hypothetical protein